MDLGERIKYLRLQKNMTQEQLAEVIGISRSALSMYELNQREPDLNTIIKFADFFQVSTDYLLGRLDYPSITTPETHKELKKLIRLVIKEIREEYSNGHE